MNSFPFHVEGIFFYDFNLECNVDHDKRVNESEEKGGNMLLLIIDSIVNEFKSHCDLISNKRAYARARDEGEMITILMCHPETAALGKL